MILTSIMFFLRIVLTLYIMLCTLRIILTWFPSAQFAKANDILCKLCDPYLNIFRKFKFLVVANIDFSPIAAICTLSVLASIVNIVEKYGMVTGGIILAILLNTIWSVISFFLLFYIVLFIVRLAAFEFKANSTSPVFQAIDTLVNPVLFRINTIIFHKRIVKYRTSILSGIALFSAVWALLLLAVDRISAALSLLPF